MVYRVVHNLVISGIQCSNINPTTSVTFTIVPGCLPTLPNLPPCEAQNYFILPVRTKWLMELVKKKKKKIFQKAGTILYSR